MQSEDLSQPQVNQIVVKALENSAKRIAAQGTEILPEGSYPFDLTFHSIGELVVNKGTPEGEAVEVIDFSPNDVLRGILANCEDPDAVVSGALAWHKKSDSGARKAQDQLTAGTLLKCAKRRKMTKEQAKPARAGAAKANPTVGIDGSVGSRSVDMEVDAA